MLNYVNRNIQFAFATKIIIFAVLSLRRSAVQNRNDNSTTKLTNSNTAHWKIYYKLWYNILTLPKLGSLHKLYPSTSLAWWHFNSTLLIYSVLSIVMCVYAAILSPSKSLEYSLIWRLTILDHFGRVKFKSYRLKVSGSLL